MTTRRAKDEQAAKRLFRALAWNDARALLAGFLRLLDLAR